MATKKDPTKAEASNAGKTLSTSSSSKAKTAAAKTLAEKSATARKVHTAPKSGSISRADVKKAVKSVSSSGKITASKRK